MTKIISTRQLSEDILSPIIKHCADHRGALTEIAGRFNKGLAKPIRMTTIQRWLCNDPAKRIDPAGGSLLRLCNIWRQMRGEDGENNRGQSVYCAVNGCHPSRNGEHCIRCGREF